MPNYLYMQVHVAVCSDRFPLTPLDAKGFVMTQPVILVTGATGKTGSAVVNQLLEQGHRVRAVVRRHDGRSESLRQAGAEIVIADLFDPEQLLGAMRGTQHAYYCPPFHPFMIQSAAAFAVAARQARLASVVVLTQWLASRFASLAVDPAAFSGRPAVCHAAGHRLHHPGAGIFRELSRISN